MTCEMSMVPCKSDLSTWMSELPSQIVDKVQLTKLVIPGSHDSGAFYLDPKSPINPSETPLIKTLGKLTKKTLIDWSITQNKQIYQQLLDGIRYFDMRTGYRSDKDDFYFVHGCYGYKMYELLESIADFVSENPKEIVIIDFQQFYQFTDTLHLRYLDKMTAIFQGKLYPFNGKGIASTLKNIWDAQKHVIVRYNNKSFADKDENLWPPDCLYSPWANTNSKKTLVSFLDERLENLSSGEINVFQAIVTPQTKNVLLGMFCCCCFPRKLSQLSLKSDRAILNWLNKVFMEKKVGVNVFMCDFIDSSVCPEYVVRLNHLLLN